MKHFDIYEIARAKGDTEFNKEFYAKTIYKYRTKLGMRQQDLADILGVTSNYIGHWEKGRTRPDMNLIPLMCKTFGITIPEFFGQPAAPGELSPEEQQHLRNYEELNEDNRIAVDSLIETMLERQRMNAAAHPVFIRILRNEQPVCAGTFNPLDSDDRGEYITVRKDRYTEQADEIITVSGNSMEPTYHDGDELLVKHTAEIGYGDIGIFIINGDGFVKEYRKNGVYSHNAKEYPFRKFVEGDDIRCIGKVIGVLDESYYPAEKEMR